MHTWQKLPCLLLAIFASLVAAPSGSAQSACGETYIDCLERTGMPWVCTDAISQCDSSSTPAISSKVCSDWAKRRDSADTVALYEEQLKRLATATDIQQVWLDRLDEFESEDYEANLIYISALDVFITVLDVTAKTVLTTVDVATLGSRSAMTSYTDEAFLELKRTLQFADNTKTLAEAESIDEAMTLHVTQQTDYLSQISDIITVIDVLRKAKDRSTDRFNALETVRFAKSSVETSLASARAEAKAHETAIVQFNLFKNEMDEKCGH